MEPFALLLVMDYGANGIFETVSAINVLLFGVFVAAVVAAVMLFSMNKKFRSMSRDLKNIAGMMERETTKSTAGD